jgi:hypothetical protein
LLWPSGVGKSRRCAPTSGIQRQAEKVTVIGERAAEMIEEELAPKS